MKFSPSSAEAQQLIEDLSKSALQAKKDRLEEILAEGNKNSVSLVYIISEARAYLKVHGRVQLGYSIVDCMLDETDNRTWNEKAKEAFSLMVDVPIEDVGVDVMRQQLVYPKGELDA